MSNPKHLQGEDWQKYIDFSKHVEQQIKGSKNIYHARAVLWVAKIKREYLGGAS